MSKLPYFDDADLKRVLCVAAHPDDLEYGASAAVARWVARGVDVSYLLLTAGEAGMRSRPPEEVAPLRAAEQRAACAAVGVADLSILDLPDGLLEADLQTRRLIAKRIREFRPDTVVVPTWQLEVDWGLNHADHRATGVATIDAIRDADNPWLFRDLHDSGLHAWGVSRLVVVGGPAAELIDVTGESLERAIASLEAHEGYLAELGEGHPLPREMLEEITGGAAHLGDDRTVTHALGVTVYPM